MKGHKHSAETIHKISMTQQQRIRRAKEKE
jgi:hypothetical protein